MTSTNPTNSLATMFKVMMMVSQVKEMIDDKEKLTNFMRNLDKEQIQKIVKGAHELHDQLKDIKKNQKES